MTNLWRDDFIKVNEYTRPGVKLSGVKKIVLHWTANPGASASKHQSYFNGTAIASMRYASAHIFVDSKEAVCIIPLNEMAYHANDTYQRSELGVAFRGVPALSPNANKYSIGVEMCVEKDGTISEAVVDRTAQIIAELCKTYKLTANDIVRHYDVTHKPCPKPFVDNPNLFVDFKARVNSILEPPIKVAPIPVAKPIVKTTVKLGDKGSAVKELQAKLKLKADGIFGPKTLEAVKKFQRANGLADDGIVGAKTWNKLA